MSRKEQRRRRQQHRNEVDYWLCKLFRKPEDYFYKRYCEGAGVNYFRRKDLYRWFMEMYLRARWIRLYVHIRMCPKRDDGAVLDHWCLTRLYWRSDA